MDLTTTEAEIVQQLRAERIAQGTALAEQIGCSTKTVQRALAKVGYFCSLNHNATFVTVQDTPRFDHYGLWTYQTVCFSQHGKLPQTLHRLVEQSPAGSTVEELEQRVGTRVHNHVSQLHQAYQAELQAVRLPAGLVHRFDTPEADGPVQKTTSRQVVTLEFDCFQALEVHRSATPQARLRDRLRQRKLQPRLKEQRSTLTDWLREHLEHPPLLAAVLAGEQAELSAATAGREVVIAYQQWLLDDAHDGHRQGFPFDPYLRYFHRRVVRGSAAVEQLLRDPRVHGRAPRVLKNFAQLLRRYLSDPEVCAAADHYEAACALFHRLRTMLRWGAQGENPLRERYLLEPSEVVGVQQSLEAFRAECRQRSVEEPEESGRKRYRIVCEHLDRYWGHLFAAPDDPCRERTTNGLESWWGDGKRRCRRRHGRKKLTREFRSLPAEFMLIANLENPQYVDLVLNGELNNLAQKLADAGRTAGPWTAWRAAQQPLNVGRLPTRLLRHDNFLEELTAVYDAHCRSDAA